MYLNGRGVPQDDAQAVAWWRKAAVQGHAGAQYNLGVAGYGNGDGVPQDYTQAVEWYRKAADQGNADEHSAASATSTTTVRVSRRTTDRRWPGIAKRQTREMRTHGRQCLAAATTTVRVPDAGLRTGGGVRYRKAAEQGIADAQLNLGNLYLDGRGVPQDDRAGLHALQPWRRRRETRPRRAIGPALRSASHREQIEKANELTKMWRPGTPLPTNSGVANK